MLAYSFLMRGRVEAGSREGVPIHRLMTIGEACRAMMREAQRTTLSWAIEQVTLFEQPYEHVVTQLGILSIFISLYPSSLAVYLPLSTSAMRCRHR